MFCEKCGAEISDDDVFCAKCGNKLKTKKSIKLTKKHIITLSIIAVFVTGLLINEYKIYRSIKTFKVITSLAIEISLDDIDKQEREMTEKCTDDGVRGKYGYSAQNIYFKQKACYKNAEKIANEKRSYYYKKLNEYKNLSYLDWRKIVILEKKKKNILAKIDQIDTYSITAEDLIKNIKLIEANTYIKNTASVQKMLYDLTGNRLLTEQAYYNNGRVYVKIGHFIYGANGKKLITGFEMKDVGKAFEYVVKKQDKIKNQTDLENMLIKKGYGKLISNFTYNQDKITFFLNHKDMTFYEFKDEERRQECLKDLRR